MIEGKSGPYFRLQKRYRMFWDVLDRGTRRVGIEVDEIGVPRGTITGFTVSVKTGGSEIDYEVDGS